MHSLDSKYPVKNNSITIYRSRCAGVYYCPYAGCGVTAKPLTTQGRENIKKAWFGNDLCPNHKLAYRKHGSCPVEYTRYVPTNEESQDLMQHCQILEQFSYHNHPAPPRVRPPKHVSFTMRNLYAGEPMKKGSVEKYDNLSKLNQLFIEYPFFKNTNAKYYEKSTALDKNFKDRNTIECLARFFEINEGAK